MSCEKATQIDIVEYLDSLRYEPAKIRGNDYGYHSPLRKEKTPSFKINRRMNCWYDHGMGKGGNLVDFGVLVYSGNVRYFVRSLTNNLSLQQHTFSLALHDPCKPEKLIEILCPKPLSSPFLFHYIRQRKIPPKIALSYCQEIQFLLHEETCYGLGFTNDSGGFEIRNAFLKISNAGKDITTFQNNSKIVEVFEGFFDSLSFVFITPFEQQKNCDYLILNSLAFFGKARPVMEQDQVVNLFFDNDRTGQNYSRYVLSLSAKYCNKSGLYEGYKDMDEWLVLFGKKQQNRLSF